MEMIREWLTSLFVSIPIFVVLAIGFVACLKHRKQRPLMTSLLLIAIAIQFGMSLGLSTLLSLVVQKLLLEDRQQDWTTPFIITFPFSLVGALTWGLAFGGVLLAEKDDDSEA